MKGKLLWCIGLALGAGVIVTDRFLHLFPDWLEKVLFVIAWWLNVAGLTVLLDQDGRPLLDPCYTQK